MTRGDASITDRTLLAPVQRSSGDHEQWRRSSERDRPPVVELTHEERQAAFQRDFDAYDGFGPPDGTIVVFPSLSFPEAELRKITGVTYYEHRLLCLTLLLAEPDRRLIFVTAADVDPDVLDYYLGFLPDPEDARRRLHIVSLSDPRPCALSQKLIEKDHVLDEIRDRVGGASAYLMPFNVTDAELEVAERLELPLFGPMPDQVWHGTKSGSRQIATQSDVPVLEGYENLRSVDDLDSAISKLRQLPAPPDGVVVKLNYGFSGQGSAIVDCVGYEPPTPARPTSFCGDGESWETYRPKIRGEGAVVERLLTDELVASPSVQIQIMPDGTPTVISTHDQVLGGEHNQVYLGCRFPASKRYRAQITACAHRVAARLAERGVIGLFGMDFLVYRSRPTSDTLRVALAEINLRVGGTTHPYVMAQLITRSTYEADSGLLRDPDGRPVVYVASDNIKLPNLVGVQPGVVLSALERAGLRFDPSTGIGATAHLLGALPEFGKMGTVCVARDLDHAEELSHQVMDVLTGV
ncbi:MAG TPA: peptide ligase PGM1-related protein [Nocardioidaceae bacterium]|nr:peptide ligase PGM1-related protein [Nocardioidaceae bacterium]